MDPAAETPDFDDILVVVGHPFGDVEVPLSVIPLRYRNDRESRQAIREGLLDDPWGGDRPA